MLMLFDDDGLTWVGRVGRTGLMSFESQWSVDVGGVIVVVVVDEKGMLVAVEGL